MNIVLVLAYDVVEHRSHIRYEDELILCVLCWRKKGGFLKNCKIVLYTEDITQISFTTKKHLSQLNVQIIEYSCQKYTIFNNSKWINRIEYLADYEQNYDSDYIINIDLDLYLKKELPVFLFNSKNVTVCNYKETLIQSFMSTKGFRENDINYDIDLKQRFLYSIQHNSYIIEESLTIHNTKLKICNKLFSMLKSIEYHSFYNKNVNEVMYATEALYDFYLNSINRDEFNLIKIKHLTNYLHHQHIFSRSDIFQITRNLQ